jgi:hypothetical protein
MSFDPKTDPADIPEHGERLDQTVLEVGTGKSYNESTEEKEDACIVKTVVDNGEREGKKLSFPLFEGDEQKFFEFCEAMPMPEMKIRDVTIEFMAGTLTEIIGKRFQASVSKVPFETDNGKYVRYRQTFFTAADGPSKVTIDPNPTQFQR